MTDEVFLSAVEAYFGGRRRAEHIIECDACHHDEQTGDFIPCPLAPRVAA